ncbi:hypothetical protein FLONG3_4413 [Fusarium longipes]|uniref:F-box domain-containing protein n=1 Tax=Fusarium longipes TaxID=694270 RepID=A0A395SYD2_9HYPO|nr:hypothetical protein FLONG3_4413 [Fusarium longipes]
MTDLCRLSAANSSDALGLGDLPPELLDTIFGHLKNDRRALGNLRLVWPSLEPVILPRLFSVVCLSFLEKHRLQFLGISSSPHLAPHVQALRWHTLCHTGGSHDGITLPQLQAFLSSDAIPNFRPLFLNGLDAMVNLRTITSVMLHPFQSRGALWHEDPSRRSIPFSNYSKLDLVQGFDNFLVPAMLRYESKVESLRILCRAVMMEDVKLGVRPTDDHSGDPSSYFRALIEAFRSLRVRLDSFALRNVKELDFCAPFPSTTFGEFQRIELQSQLCDIISAAKGLRILSLRSTDPASELKPNKRHATGFPQLFELQFQYLNTLKLVNMVFNTAALNIWLAKHAQTLQHILLYNCAACKGGLSSVVRFAAADPNVRLHRFSVCIPETTGLGPWKEGQTAAAQIIPEQEIVDFINSNDSKNEAHGNSVEHAARDPFLHRQPIGSEDWHFVTDGPLDNIPTVDHYADLWATAVESPEKLSSEWSQWRSLHYACKACRRLGNFE